MNNVYIHDDYLLNSPLARHLYHDFAKHLPIIDYHNHLDAKEIWDDAQPKDLCEAWLTSDHYVWRAMRSNGVDEHFVTGEAAPREKFEKWCETVPYLIGNPLYQWSHLELKRFFDNDLLINSQNAKSLWAMSEKQFAQGKNSTRQVIEALNVKTLCTTDSPFSHLPYHTALQATDFATQVLPTFRADELFDFHNLDGARKLIDQLETFTGIKVCSFSNMVRAIENRIEVFHLAGCRLADLGLKTVDYAECSEFDAEALFQQLLKGESLNQQQVIQLNTRLFFELGKLYHKFGWSSQIHIGVLVSVNKRRQSELGGGTGFSVINDRLISENLCQLLSDLDSEKRLPNTVLYSLNPAHNPILCCIAGAFQDSDSAAGKIQFGAAWWFNDHKDGMEAQLTTLKNLGALGRFVGMLTDSRNVFSFSRHEYFRRVLCNLIAKWVVEGEIPNDEALLKTTIENICYFNAKRFFKFDLVEKVGV